jgi:hypothetical protein
MVVTCAFYGFINRTTKVTLQVDRNELEVGRPLTFEGHQYVILSVCGADDRYHANVGATHLQRLRPPAPLKAPALYLPVAAPQDVAQARGPEPETVLEARLQAAEARLKDVLRERDEALRLLDHAIQQLDRLQQMAER